MNRRFCLAPAMLGLLVAASACAAPTTYVATYGSDANPCSLVQPCRSFASAIAQTNDQGEIVVLDSGGYGPVVIAKSVSIVAPPGVYAGISVFGGRGIDIQPPAARVRLTGLTITGFGSLGDTGIVVTAAAHVLLGRSTISGFLLGGAAMNVYSGAGQLHVIDSTLHSNSIDIVASDSSSIVIERSRFQNGMFISRGSRAAIVDSAFTFGFGVGLGVVTADAGTPGVSIHRSVFVDNGAGLMAQGSHPALANVSVSRSVFFQNQSGIDIGGGFPGGTAIDVSSSVFADNVQFAIRHFADDPAARLLLSGNTIVRNANGVDNVFGHVIESRGDNTIRNNGANGGPFTPLSGL
jgi:hypothetical protein